MQTQRTDERDAIGVEGDLPTGWWAAGDASYRHAAGEPGGQARIDVAGGPVGADAEAGDVAERIARDLRAQRPDLLVANLDVWPHPVWGVGRLLQTAYVEGATTLAHDVYVFVHAGRTVRVDVRCPLVDLLRLEDGVARVVAALRPACVGATR